MIKAYRKKHLQVWAALAVLIPLGIACAVMVTPKPVASMLLQPTPPEALPLLLKKVEKADYVASLRCNVDTSALQLEWLNVKTLAVPSALIYQVEKPNGALQGEDTLLIGRVQQEGYYWFALKKGAGAPINILVFDIIHHTTIDSFSF